ncbi:MAG: hypothetical protein II357_02615 [Clostridia bacterium]|nr:hypothetical protein [Clostridia bacterium]
MDNLKYYNESLAYDFEMFMPHTEEREKDNIIKMPEPKVRARQHAAAKAMSVSVFAVMAAVFMLAALCGNIFLRLRINEVNNQITDMKATLNELKSEETALEVEFERRISYSNIELQAAELGMSKCSKDQVKYIRVNDKDAALVDENIVVSENE